MVCGIDAHKPSKIATYRIRRNTTFQVQILCLPTR